MKDDPLESQRTEIADFESLLKAINVYATTAVAGVNMLASAPLGTMEALRNFYTPEVPGNQHVARMCTELDSLSKRAKAGEQHMEGAQALLHEMVVQCATVQDSFRRRDEAWQSWSHYDQKVQKLRDQLSRSTLSSRLAEKVSRNEQKRRDSEAALQNAMAEAGAAVHGVLSVRWSKTAEALSKICRFYIVLFDAAEQLIEEFTDIAERLVGASTATRLAKKANEVATAASERVNNFASGLRDKVGGMTTGMGFPGSSHEPAAGNPFDAAEGWDPRQYTQAPTAGAPVAQGGRWSSQTGGVAGSSAGTPTGFGDFGPAASAYEQPSPQAGPWAQSSTQVAFDNRAALPTGPGGGWAAPTHASQPSWQPQSGGGAAFGAAGDAPAARPRPGPGTPYSVGDPVEVYVNSEWFQGTVLQVARDRLRIEFVVEGRGNAIKWLDESSPELRHAGSASAPGGSALASFSAAASGAANSALSAVKGAAQTSSQAAQRAVASARESRSPGAPGPFSQQAYQPPQQQPQQQRPTNWTPWS